MDRPTDKQSRHAALVRRCRSGKQCARLINTGDRDYPSPWSRLAGSLDAKVVIVGQDFSAQDRTRGPNLTPDPAIPTNRNLQLLLKTAQLDLDTVYLTNAILCLKPGKQLNSATQAAWFHACRPLLRETIDIVAPRAVIALGVRAWDSVQRVFGLTRTALRSAVDAVPR